MAKCDFSIDFPGTAEDIVARAQAALGKAGGSLSGDTAGGQFNLSTPIGTIEGIYTIGGQTMHIQITDKPMFVGCGMIESELRKYLTK